MPGQPKTRKGIYGKSGPPAPKGHRYSVKHGGLVTQKTHALEMKAKQKELEVALSAAAPVRSHNGKLPVYDEHIVSLLAAVMVQFDNMTEFAHENGFLDKNGDPLTFVDVYGKVADRIARILDKLGMTPSSRAKLGLALVKSATLAEALSEPDKDKRMEMLADLGVIEGEEVTDEQ